MKPIFTHITRLAAAIRRLNFQFVKSIGVFWLIERIPSLTIKEPYNKMYQRSKPKS
jgi:hypothetical protein